MKTTKSAQGNSSETPLTGTTLASASAAVQRCRTRWNGQERNHETDDTGAYEVVVTKTDDSRVKVIEDASFKVLSTTATSCP